MRKHTAPRCPLCGITVSSSLKVAYEGDKAVPAGNAYWLAEHIRWHKAEGAGAVKVAA